jgi:hypothetical protein
VRLSSRKAACIFVAHQAPQEIRVRSTPIAKPLQCRCTSCRGGGGGRLAASAPQFQSGWRIPLKPPIELSNINVPWP